MSRRSLGGLGVRAVAALAVTITLAGGLFASPALAAPPGVDPSAPASVSTVSFRATQVSDFDQRVAAASTIGESVGSREARLADLNFVIWIYNKAPFNSNIKKEALKALSNEVDENACYDFIVTGIHRAFREDVRAIPVTDERHRLRVRAAERIGWTVVEPYYLDANLSEFVTQLFIKTNGTEWPEIKAQASAVLSSTSTDEQRQAFVATGIETAYNADVQRRREAAEREKLEQLEKEKNLKARGNAWQIVVPGGTLTPVLANLTDSEFAWEIYNAPLARKFVKAAANAALGTHDAAQIKTYIFTGIHIAHQKDVAEQDAARAAETEKKIKEIIDAARVDGYMPSLLAAATAALAGDLNARNAFIDLGQYDAAKKDVIKPSHHQVVQLKGQLSGRCVQIAGADGQAVEYGQYNELWDCYRTAAKELWILKAWSNGEFFLENLNSQQCLDGHSDLVRQYPCDVNNGYHRWTFVQNTDGSYQIKNVGSGKYATAKDGGKENATHVATYGNTNDGNQRWRLINPVHRSDVSTVSVGRYQLKGVQSGRCMQTAGLWDQPNQGALANFAGQELWDCVGGGKMAWDLVGLGGKRYALKNVMSGKCLDVKGTGHINGTPLVQYDCHHGGSQQFVFIAQPDGSYVLENVFNGKAADAMNNAVQNGAWIGVHEMHGQTNQRWTLVPA
ncbi:RICIN domain-containing protein [Lentzea californiensis]|uniref:RICIN domain-containing protein n=1 Tax=Lentzea californiensis TaxID=438851 RepID=UPI0021653822|nr:RICIN domain-containing protein [Lentzea californiensis]